VGGEATYIALIKRATAAGMDFLEYDFAAMNEADIREEIIAPLLKFLGYRSGAENNVIREQSLQYPKSPLGRKKPNDPPIRGRADYICEAQRKVRWVIEAKPPNTDISDDDNEQAYSYANHPEIRFQIFQTNRGPDQPHVFQCTYGELPDALVTIENMLSPEAILNTFPEAMIDTGLPIGKGLRSIVRVTNGTIIYETNSLGNKPLEGMTFMVSRGAVERNETGQLKAYLETTAPFQPLQKLNEKLGLHKLTVLSADTVVSSDPSKPTRFTGVTEHILPKGEKCLNLNTWKEVNLIGNIHVQTTTTAEGILSGNIFEGRFEGRMLYQVPGIVVPGMPMEISVHGSFRIYLS